MKKYQVNIRDRENNFTDIIWYPISVPANSKSITLSDMDRVKSKFIYGIAIRMQANELGVTRWSKNGNALLSRNEMAKGHINLKKGSDVISDAPLEHFGFDPNTHSPGEFAQIILPEGFDPSSSTIKFPTGAVTTGGDIEIGFIFHEPNKCVLEPICL